MLRADGRLVLADLFATWLRPTAARQARTVGRMTTLLEQTGFAALGWHRV